MSQPSDEHALRNSGIHMSAQRLAVWRAIKELPHGSADEVERVVRERIGTISRQAVYDALGTLTEAGLLRRIQPAGSPARYENRVADNHHHVICRECGAMADVDCAVGYTPCLQASESAGFTIDEAEVIYWGICHKCRVNQPLGDGSTAVASSIDNNKRGDI